MKYRNNSISRNLQARGINDVGQAETSCVVSVSQPMEEPKFTSLLRSAKAVEGSPIKLEGNFWSALDDDIIFSM